MRLLIVSATNSEVAPLLNSFPFEVKQNIFSLSKNHHQVDVLISGVGAVATTFHVMNYLQHHHPDAAIQAGIAGVNENFATLGECFDVKEDCFVDVGAFENNQYNNLFDLKLVNANEFPFQNQKLINQSDFPLPFHPLKKAHARSVNLIEADKNRLEIMNQKFSCDAESMEGAAFHYIMLNKKIHFKQLRAASNQIGERDKSKWEMKKSIENLNEILINVVNDFLK